MLEERKRRRRIFTITAVLLLLGNILLFLTIWLLQKYDHVYFDQLLYQLKAPAEGAQGSLVSSAAVRVGVFAVGLTLTEVFLCPMTARKLRRRCAGKHRRISSGIAKVSRFFMRRALPLALSVFILSLSVFIRKFDVLAYVDTVSTESDFIEEHYADPETTPIRFPEKKRNLIYIFLESMESTFADVSAGGSITDDFISELSSLAEENVNFSHTSGIGGAYSYSGATWTASAMVAQTSGLIVKVPLAADAYGAEEGYMPGVVSIGELLKAQGYRQTLLVGSDAEFHGREPYFMQHGSYEIVDINSLKEEGRLPEDYDEWWGFEDEKLFAFAKEELAELAESGEPFNLTMLTADTHFPDGYECRLCGHTYEEQYANVLACSAKQVAKFVEWVQEQPFYDNTTIVISGDHLTMDPLFLEDIDQNYVRTTYNCIINAPVTPVQEKGREFATFDMFPTTLAALGAEITGERLGLGTNLFSAEKTLTEQYGYVVLDEELQKNSAFYNEQFLDMEEPLETLLPESMRFAKEED